MNDAKPIIRCDGNDRPDDIAISNVSLFRLERMDDGHVWVCAYRGAQRVAVGLHSAAPIAITLNEDQLGCEYETRGEEPSQ